MIESLKVCLPIADVLIVKPVDDMFAQDQIGQVDIGPAVEQARRSQVGLVYRSALIAAADGYQDLLAQPFQVGFELRQQCSRGEIPREGLVAMEQILRILLNDDINRVQQPLQIAFLNEGRTDIRHDEIADEHDAQIGQMDEHGVVSFTALHGNELDACASDLPLRAAVDGDVGLEAAHIVEIKACPEKLLAENVASVAEGNL